MRKSELKQLIKEEIMNELAMSTKYTTRTGLRTLISILKNAQEQLDKYSNDLSKKDPKRTQILKIIDKSIGDLYKSQTDINKLEKLIIEF